MATKSLVDSLNFGALRYYDGIIDSTSVKVEHLESVIAEAEKLLNPSNDLSLILSQSTFVCNVRKAFLSGLWEEIYSKPSNSIEFYLRSSNSMIVGEIINEEITSFSVQLEKRSLLKEYGEVILKDNPIFSNDHLDLSFVKLTCLENWLSKVKLSVILYLNNRILPTALHSLLLLCFVLILGFYMAKTTTRS